MATLFGKLDTVKEFVRPLFNTDSETPLTVNILKDPKLLQNLHQITFTRFFQYFERPSFGK